MITASPGVLNVTGSVFRPVQQTAYMIRGGPGGLGGSSTDSCVKPDASSTSSNNEVTTTNNEHSIGEFSIHGSAVERQSLASVLSPSCARPVADG